MKQSNDADGHLFSVNKISPALSAVTQFMKLLLLLSIAEDKLQIV